LTRQEEEDVKDEEEDDDDEDVVGAWLTFASMSRWALASMTWELGLAD
jgi:hypothetical protein